MSRYIFTPLLLLCGLLFAAPELSAQSRSGATESEQIARLLGNRNFRPTLRTRTPQSTTLRTPAPLTAAAKAEAKVPTICGSLLYSYQWATLNEAPYGIYGFEAQSPISYEPLALSSNLFALGGGCYHNGHYSLVSYYETMGALIASYYEYDAETWELLKRYNNVGVGSIAVDMTYDTMSGKIYGCFINDTRDGYVFGTLNTNSGERVATSNLPGPIFAMACNSQGQLFGIDSRGRLLSIDKNTGATTVIGATGLVPYNTQSAAFDLQTDRMYWAACTQNEQGLYELNLSTGAATLIAPFQNGEEWGGLYVAPPAASEGAPAAVENLVVSYDPNSTANALVEFTLPQLSFDGNPLNGTLNYTLTLNGNEVESGSGEVGTPVNLTLYNTTVGQATIGVRCANDKGQSPAIRTSLYLGHDAPCAVNDLHLKVTNEGNVISWTPPTTSLHGGYCDLESVTYRVVRQPEGRVIANRLTATTFTDQVAPLVLSEFSYDVIPYAGSLQGESRRTEKVLVGDAFEVPYYEGFDSEADFGLFTVIDANGDGSTWFRQTDGTAQSYYSMKESMNDWLITPPIHLTTEQLYRLSLSAKVMNGFPERMEIWAGRERSVQGMTQLLLPAADYSNASYETFGCRFGVEEEGDWYIGLHCISPAERYRMNVDWLRIDADLLTQAPAAPEQMTVTAAPLGAHGATISFKAPTLRINGTPLSDIQQIKVYRGQKLVHTFNKPTLGEVLSFDENELPTGMISYRAEALNTAGPGLEATAEAYVGIDTPALPTNVRVELVNDSPVISWTAPTAGAHGGYVCPDSLTYYVQRGTDELLIAQALTENFCTDTYFNMPTEQEEIFYYVYAASATGIGNGQASNILVVGPAYSLPFKESFTGGYLEHSLWGIIDTPNTGVWGIVTVGTMPMCEGSDADGGLLEFMPTEAGDESFLYSGKIDINQVNDPQLSFDFYYYPQQKDYLEVQISTNGTDWATIGGIDYEQLYGEAEWRTVNVGLGHFLPMLDKTGYLQIGFRAVSTDGIWRLHMDNIHVTDNTNSITRMEATRLTTDCLYDLTGRRKTKHHKGIYINNGHKYILSR